MCTHPLTILAAGKALWEGEWLGRGQEGEKVEFDLSPQRWGCVR